MKRDPTRTNTMIKGLQRALKKLFTNFQHASFSKIEKSISIHRQKIESAKTLSKQKLIQNSAITEIQDIIDTTEYKQIATKLKPILSRYSRQTYESGARKGVTDINRIAGYEAVFYWTQTDIEAVNMMIDHDFALVQGASASMKKDLMYVISTGMMEGQSIPKISKAMRIKLNLSKKRATMIARTEVIRNYNQANLNKYKQNGIKKWRWLAAIGDRTCQICESLDNQIFNMGDPQPPIHPNCRCAVAPYIDESATPLNMWK